MNEKEMQIEELLITSPGIMEEAQQAGVDITHSSFRGGLARYKEQGMATWDEQNPAPEIDEEEHFPWPGWKRIGDFISTVQNIVAMLILPALTIPLFFFFEAWRIARGLYANGNGIETENPDTWAIILMSLMLVLLYTQARYRTELGQAEKMRGSLRKVARWLSHFFGVGQIPFLTFAKPRKAEKRGLHVIKKGKRWREEKITRLAQVEFVVRLFTIAFVLISAYGVLEGELENIAFMLNYEHTTATTGLSGAALFQAIMLGLLIYAGIVGLEWAVDMQYERWVDITGGKVKKASQAAGVIYSKERSNHQIVLERQYVNARMNRRLRSGDTIPMQLQENSIPKSSDS